MARFDELTAGTRVRCLLTGWRGIVLEQQAMPPREGWSLVLVRFEEAAVEAKRHPVDLTVEE